MESRLVGWQRVLDEFSVYFKKLCKSFKKLCKSCKKSLPTEEDALASYIANKLELVRTVNFYQKINWGSCKDTKSAF